MPNNVWSELLARIETKVNRHSFNTWFSPTVFVEDTGDRVTVRVPSELCRNWLTKHYTAVLTEATAEVQRSGVKIAFVIDVDAGNVEPQSPSVARAPAPGAAARGLNPRYTFDSFVVGSSNQFAHAASLAVGEAPSRSYNPLYLYGGVGLGKTHLMHAIGHYLLGQMPDLSLTYISSERFMNEMINAVRYDRILDFRERYRRLDVLMVDDVQFLSGKEGTQTEFFHTFNSLYDAQKQIVISSDCPPHEIQHPRGTAEIAVRMGPDRRHPVAGSRDQDRDSQERRPRPRPSRCATTWRSTSPAASSPTSGSWRDRSSDSSRTPR